MHLDSTALSAVAEAAEQVLGRGHPLVARIRALALDGDDAHLVFAEIEGLPAAERRALAGLAAAFLMPRLASPSARLH